MVRACCLTDCLMARDGVGDGGFEGWVEEGWWRVDGGSGNL